MNVEIEVVSGDVDERRVISKKDGQEYLFRSQTAYLHRKDEAYPTRFSLSLGDEQDAFKPGRYGLKPSSIYVNHRGDLVLAKRPQLEELKAADLKRVS